MYRTVQLLFSIFLLAALFGCVPIGGVARIPEAEVVAPDANHSVVIFGIGVEGDWEYPRFAVVLDEYDIERQSITGNCWRYNRMEASVPKDSKAMRRFAFEVKPGYFAFSGFNSVELVGSSAFSAPAGQIVYLGDFIYSGERKLVLRRSEDALKGELLKEYPNLADKIALAEAISVATPKMFLCTP